MLDLLLTCQFCLKRYGRRAVHEYRSKIIMKATTENTNDACMLKHLFDHFNEGWHSSYRNDVSVIFLDEADPSELRNMKIIKKKRS